MELLNRIEPPVTMKNKYSEILDVNRAAISAFDMAYHFPLSQEWKDL